MYRQASRVVSVLCILLVAVAGVAWAQDSEIRGTVKDNTGGVIPGVEVTVRNVETGVSRTVLTDNKGFYAVPQLFAGNYQVTCSMMGFNTQQLKLLLDPQQTTEQNFKLSVGAPSNVVDVVSTAARINVNPYDVATVIEEKQIHELPLDGRNYLALANLSPGIIKGNQARRGNQTDEGFKSGGLAMEHVAISLDGVDNTGRVVYGPLATQSQTATPPPEAISEFKVITNNTSAEYGNKAGATVLISTKGGTNQFHGSVYEFHRNAAVSANNFMFNRDGPRDPDTNELTAQTPPYIRNQYGGTFGGPVIKDKTFFFFSFQGTRLVESGSSFLRNVPSPLARMGDFSQEDCSRNGRCPDIYDPMTQAVNGDGVIERQPFPNNVIPSNRVDPAAIQVLNLFPMPNVAGADYTQNNYFYVQRNNTESELYDFRIDHNFTDNHRIFGRYSYRNEDRVNAPANAFPFPARSSNISAFRTKQFSLNYNASLGSKVHNEFRGGFSKFPASRTDEHTENLNAKFGIPNSLPEQYPELVSDPQHFTGLVFFNFGGVNGIYSLLGGGSAGGTISGRLDTRTIADNLLWDVGNHSLKFGVEYRRWDNLRSQLGINDLGQMHFDGRYTAQFPNDSTSRRNTGHAIADAMLGLTRATNSGLPNGEDMNIPYWGFYAQDDWRITPRLTLNIGLRYELFMQPRINLGSGLQNSKAEWFVHQLDETSPTIDVEFDRWYFPQSSSDCGCEIDKNDWAPRLGLAYRIAKNTVVRAGAGIYYSEDSAAGITSNRYNAGGPVATFFTENPNSFTEWPTTVSAGFPLEDINFDADPTVYAFNAVGGEGAPNIPRFKETTTVYQYFMDVQHQLPWDILMTIGYNGMSGTNLPWWNRNFAAPLEPGTLPAGNPARWRLLGPEDTNTLQQLRAWQLTGDNVLNASYHALHFKTEKRFSDGLSFTSSFTWSKGLDYGVSSLNERTEGIAGGAAPLGPYAKDLWRNHGPGGLSRDFVYNLSVLYELPAGPGKGRFQSGPASWFLGGWQVGGIVSLESGPWGTTIYTPNTQNTGGAYRGILVGEPNIPEKERDSMSWWNPSAITAGPEGEWGDVGRGILELPGWKNVDFLMSKNFALPMEGHRIQFRFEAFNFTNTPHLGAPGNTNPVTAINAASANAARIFIADQPRIIQFALKYVF